MLHKKLGSASGSSPQTMHVGKYFPSSFAIWLEMLLIARMDFYVLGFYIAFNTVQVISRRVVGRAEETST